MRPSDEQSITTDRLQTTQVFHDTYTCNMCRQDNTYVAVQRPCLRAATPAPALHKHAYAFRKIQRRSWGWNGVDCEICR